MWKTDPDRLFNTKIGKRFQNAIATVDRVNKYIDEVERFIRPPIDTYNSTARTRSWTTELAIVRDPLEYGIGVELGLRVLDRDNDKVFWEVTIETFSYSSDPQRAIAIQQRPRIGQPNPMAAVFGDAEDFPVPYQSRWFEETVRDFKDKLVHLLEQHDHS